jgi:hypothetical protein
LISISFLSSSQSFGAATTEVANALQRMAKPIRFMSEAPWRSAHGRALKLLSRIRPYFREASSAFAHKMCSLIQVLRCFVNGLREQARSHI